jgi:hypothetical protein
VKVKVHTQIASYVKGAKIVDRGDRDGALNKIVELINSSRINHSEMLRLKEKFEGFDASQDEPWDTTTSIQR